MGSPRIGKELHALAHSRETYHCLGKKARKPSENLVLGREVSTAFRGRGAVPLDLTLARRGGPPFSDPFGRCGHDLIKPTTSQRAT